MSLKKGLMLAGVLLVVLAILAACSKTETPTGEPTAEPTATLEVPFLGAFTGSGHAKADAEAFNHWNEEDPAVVPVACAKCHTSTGYQDYLGADGSAAGAVDAEVAAPAGTLACVTCHNPTAVSLRSVTFPSGVVISDLGDDARCMVCHQGVESKVSVDAAIEKAALADADTVAAPDVLGFKNVHYFAAAATLYGTEVKGGYEYEGMTYDAKNDHVEGYDSCIGCHDPHTLQVKIEQCAICHDGVATADDLKDIRMVSSAKDYDGDGDVEEGMFYEIQGLQEILYAQIQAYAKDKAGTAIVYSAEAYPYFFIDTNANGAVDEGEAAFPNSYKSWTPRLLKAAYNYQVSIKDPGAFAHGNKYIVQLLHDSIADLGGDVSALARVDAGHFAGNNEQFRHWDEEEGAKPAGIVPGECAKCHTGTGLPIFLNEEKYSRSGGAMNYQHATNGLACSTCHVHSEEFPARLAVNSVKLPSGKSVSFGDAADSNLCLECHQGRESKASVDRAISSLKLEEDDPSTKLTFRNIHYFTAGVTFFGTEAQGAYEYNGKTYFGKNAHPAPADSCVGCHDAHALEVNETLCATCHQGAKPEAIRAPGDAVDYDGDGDVTEGLVGEIETLTEALLEQFKVASAEAGTPIIYTVNYPYWAVDADGDGQGDRDADNKAVQIPWTPRLLKAAFNYQYVTHDPGAFAHNPMYVIQILIDSIEDLGGDVSKYTRPEVPPAQ
jgi:hypothetical protein